MGRSDAERGRPVQDDLSQNHTISGSDRTPHETLTLALDDVAPERLCVACKRPTLRTNGTEWPMHAHCEPPTIATAPATSWDAGKRVKRGRSSLVMWRLVELLRDLGPMTDDELRSMMPEVPHGSVAKRRLDAVREGLVVDSGTTRPTRTGCQSIVWRAVP